jgi:hypothetical protein
MLAYYTSLIKREELVKRLSEDGNDLATLANDLVCELKTFTAACSNGNIESCLDALNKANELVKVISAMTLNVENNYKSYVSSLVPHEERVEQKQEEIKEEEKEAPSIAEPNQLVTLLEAVRSLKEMKDSLDK